MRPCNYFQIILSHCFKPRIPQLYGVVQPLAMISLRLKYSSYTINEEIEAFVKAHASTKNVKIKISVSLTKNM